MNKTLKKTLSIILTVLMIVTTIPLAFAAEAVSYVDFTWDEESKTLSSKTKSVDTYTVITSTTTEMTSGWYVVKGEVTVAERMTATGEVHLILADGAHLTASEGITVNEGNSLYIYSQSLNESTMGKLTAATTSGGNAVIGGLKSNHAGVIEINGGDINVTADNTSGAGIGSGNSRGGYHITINAGKVTASASFTGAAIGSGSGGEGSNPGSVHSIIINGGVVKATVTANYSAAIGGGNWCSGGDITITGGTVVAENWSRGAAIGGGYDGNGGNITITGGNVTAIHFSENSSGGAGIGGGYNASGGNTIITGGTVTAQGGFGASGIGGYVDAGNIVITGGTVNATGGVRAAGIGGGVADKNGGSITILGGNVTATKGSSAVNDIGAGEKGAPISTMMRDGNTVTVTGSHPLIFDYTISKDTTLYIPEGATLRISNGVKLTNNGTLIVEGSIICATHNYDNGVCICGDYCEHLAYENGVCSACGRICYHWYENGVCEDCGMNCEHFWMDGECMYCRMVCGHSDYEGYYCTLCGSICGHNYENGTCSICGDFGFTYDAETNTYNVLTAGGMQGAADAAGVTGTAENPAIIKPMNDIELAGVPNSFFPDEFDYCVRIDTGTIILDLNGKTISNTIADNLFIIGEYGGSCDAVVTVIDSSDTQTGKLYGTGHGVLSNNDGGTLIINSGTMITEGAHSVNTVNSTNAKLTVNGGYIFASTTDTNSMSSAVHSQGVDAVLTVTDGTLTARGKYGESVSITAGACTITGGVLTGDQYAVYISSHSTGLVSITGGSLSGGTADLCSYSYTELLGVDEKGNGAIFPDGLSVANDNINNILYEGAICCDADGKQISLTDGQTSINGTVVIKAAHNHNYEYTANGDIITAACTADGCDNTDGGSIKIVAPVNPVYDGAPKTVEVENNLVDTKKAYTVTYSTPDGSAPVNAGTYTATLSLDGETVTASVELTIAKANYNYTEPTANNLIYNNKEQALVAGGTAMHGEMEYSLDGQSWSTTVPAAKDVGDYTVYYQIIGDANFNDVAGSLTVTIAECPHASYTDGICDNCEYECTHSWGEGVLTRPTLVGAGGIVGGEHWQEGYYTYTCSLCGVTYTEEVERADGSAFNDAVWEIKDFIGNEMLTQEARDEIHQSYLGVLENNSEFADEDGFIRIDLIASEQGIIDEAVAELQKIIDTAEAKIASGEYVKADYSEIDEAIKAVDEALENATISEEMANELSDIKAQLETLKADSNTSAADLANSGLFDRVETITETMNNCADGNHTDEDGDYLCDNGCGHEFENPADNCDHLCHKDGILGFLWKIISFFQRLFGIQQYCDCGALHYEKAIFG